MKHLLLPANMDSSWKSFLTEERLEQLDDICENLGESVNPRFENILRFLKVNLSEVKVILLGQDPYPQQGMATGRAFEVGGLTSWHQSFRQVSLKNIVRLIHKSHKHITRYEDILSFSRIQQEIKQGDFPILPPDKLFSSWEQQGVLLLNTSFTCIPGIPGSHESLWTEFTCQLLQYISSFGEFHWFLWGKSACDRKDLLRSGIFHISRHPMMCSEKYDDDFLKSDCFLKTAHLIHWLG